jgi:arginyl-tRNA synthetase
MEAYLAEELRLALSRLGDLPQDFDPDSVELEFETPNNPEHGDLATSVALRLARPLRRSPRQIAEQLVSALDLDPARVHDVDIAGPGFINFRFARDYVASSVAAILAQGDGYGRSASGAGKKAIVEYVSANPTGPLTVGHGRNAVLGDTIANLLEWTGYRVTREYYFNDAGRQMRVLGESVRARYHALVDPDLPTRTLDGGEDRIEVPQTFPEDGYLGEYITEIAARLVDEHGDALMEAVRADDARPFSEAAREAIFREIEATMERLNIRMDSYFNEFDLYESRAVWDVVERLREKDLVYEKEGAVWFKTGQLGKVVSGEPKDTVLVKSSGEPTYRLPDIAYHLDKLERGYDRIVDVFGADHIATYPDVVRGVEALGGDASRIDVLVYQFVTLVRGGEPVKMSTRKANYVTLDELMDEVGPDVVRFFFLMLSPDTHLNFDLDLAREAGEKNPVFYLQYAHARICSIMAKAEEVGLEVAVEPDWALLNHETEEVLMKEMLTFPDVVTRAAEAMEPHRLASYLRDVATAFSHFYRDCRIVGEEEQLAAARLALARAARITLHNGLTILGVSAPDRM